MKVFLLLSLACLGSSRQTSQGSDHKFVTSFVVTPERNIDEDRKGREIIEIIPDATTVSTLSHYPLDCPNQKECSPVIADTTPMPTFRPYSQEELNSYLKKYVDGHRRRPEVPDNKLPQIYIEDGPANILSNVKEKSKSWQLMQSQSQSQNRPPHDDRTGWVTLEPVPWSSSQIQKWEPNKRPSQIPQWDQSEYQPNKWQDRPWNKPSYEYKPEPTYKPKPTYDYNRPGWSDSWGSGSDIITDNRPSSFPQDRNKQWYKPQETNEQLPGDGDGKWVLLSSTKGYSLPQRDKYQRSLVVKPTGQQLKSHRSVRLTVLPPEDNANTTTSHGGMLEVEKGTQTVEESQREHAAKMMKLSQSPVAAKRSSSVRVYPIKLQQPKNNAVLAAVGAGMIPATMAMLLPMVLGRKRRNAEEEPHFIHSHNIYSY